MNLKKLFLLVLILILVTSLCFIHDSTVLFSNRVKIVQRSSQGALLKDSTTIRKIPVTYNTTPKPTKNRSLEITIEEMVILGSRETFPNGVPRIVHYNYKDKMLPSQYVPLIDKCIEINPNVTFVLWSDSSSFNFVKNHYPKFLEIYKSYLPSGEALKKSDIMRFFTLYHFGGIYMDLDTRCQKPFDEVMKNDSCILSKEAEVQTRIRWNAKYSAMNSFMACVSNHYFFKYGIDSIRKDDNSHIMWNTGPFFLTDRFDKYNKTLNGTHYGDRRKYIILGDSDTFSPYTERYLEQYCNKPSGEWQVRGCKDLPAFRKVEKEVMDNAVLVHLFYHLGYGFAQGDIKKRLDATIVKGLNIVVQTKSGL